MSGPESPAHPEHYMEVIVYAQNQIPKEKFERLLEHLEKMPDYWAITVRLSEHNAGVEVFNDQMKRHEAKMRGGRAKFVSQSSRKQ